MAVFSIFALAACGDDTSGSAGPHDTTTSGGGGGHGSEGGGGHGSGNGGGGGSGGSGGGAGLLGTWKSKSCEPSSPMSSQRRTYVFTPTDIAITFDLYAGAACEAGPKLMTITVHGTSQIVGPSQAVQGATDVVFTFKSKAITPAAAGVNFLKASCGQYPWAAGMEQDVTKDGCGALLATEAACPAEYDLSAIIDNVLYFGDRSHPLCSKDTRPTTLSKWGIVKQP